LNCAFRRFGVIAFSVAETAVGEGGVEWAVWWRVHRVGDFGPRFPRGEELGEELGRMVSIFEYEW